MYLREMRGAEKRHRNRMQFPGYPSNREADKSDKSHCESGKARR